MSASRKNYGKVQGKMDCIYEVMVLEEQSAKRPEQSYRVVSSKELRQSALSADIQHSHPTEKIDGTCVYVSEFMGKAWLWPRHDRKPVKATSKRFQTHTNKHRAWQAGDTATNEPQFNWDMSTDFRETPDHWLPAVTTDTSSQPDSYGRISGWVPLQVDSRLHCWHNTAVDLIAGTALVLECRSDKGLQIVETPLQEMLETTMELIGTHINSNPYNIGSKKQPLHVFVRHGHIPFKSPPPLQHEKLNDWFQFDPEGTVEGIVWHCSDGKMYKVHRHHFGLKWPVDDTRLQSCPVLIAVKPRIPASYNVHLSALASLDGHLFNSLSTIAW